MNLVDSIIIILLLFGAALGFKRGFTRQALTLVGTVLILFLSFTLKNPISIFLYNNLPFFKFGGIIKGATALNIILYEIIAFFIVFFVLSIVFKVLLTISKIFEKILTATIILGIPSKILGMILGVVEYIIISFIGLYILSLPMLEFNLVKDSKLAAVILTKTPVLNEVCNDTLNTFNEIIELKEVYKNTSDTKEFNQKALDLMIEKNIITKENAKKLIDSGKLEGLTIEE